VTVVVVAVVVVCLLLNQEDIKKCMHIFLFCIKPLTRKYR